MGVKVFLTFFTAFVQSLAATTATPVPDAPTPPSDPEILGKGTVSRPDRYEYCQTLSRDRRTLYVGIEHGTWQSIERYTWNGTKWSDPKPIIGAPDYNAHDPYLSADEKRLYFITASRGNADLAYLPRSKGEGWGEPIFLKAPINGSQNDYYTSITRDGEVIFSSNRQSSNAGSYDLYSASLAESESGKSNAEAKRLPAPINTGAYEGDPYIDPDRRYLLFASNRKGGKGRGDLYLAVGDGQGGWSDPIAFDERVNTSGHELCPLVSLDGSAFMFTSNKDLHWVSSAIIDEMIEAYRAEN